MKIRLRFAVQAGWKHSLLLVIAGEQTSSNSLLEKIHQIFPEAGKNLQDARLSYTQICDLTLTQLEELLPGIKYLGMRRKIKDVIEEHWETSSWREKISCISQTVAEELQDAGLRDEQISTLKQTELNELLPGLHNFQHRREIMSLIKQRGKVPGAQLGHREPPKMPEGQQNALDANHLQGEPLVENAEGGEMPWKPLCDGKKSPESAIQNEQASKSKLYSEARQCSSVDTFLVQPAKMATGLNSLPPIHALRQVNVHILGDFQIAQIFVQQMSSQINPCSLEQCRVVLFFCAATSLKGEEIEAALSYIPDNKDTILVVGQQPPFILKTSRVEDINGKNLIKETVDFLFYPNTGQTGNAVNNHSISRLHEVLQRYG
ncbi:hypothetical protein GJAV_G00117800 [Gymnothorax javanicus]|nr:hypothetical protein GJAV_G00117800 [Gymnothorax javanicus]